jgi:hypothetical protein
MRITALSGRVDLQFIAASESFSAQIACILFPGGLQDRAKQVG